MNVGKKKRWKGERRKNDRGCKRRKGGGAHARAERMHSSSARDTAGRSLFSHESFSLLVLGERRPRTLRIEFQEEREARRLRVALLAARLRRRAIIWRTALERLRHRCVWRPLCSLVADSTHPHVRGQPHRSSPRLLWRRRTRTMSTEVKLELSPVTGTRDVAILAPAVCV